MFKTTQIVAGILAGSLFWNSSYAAVTASQPISTRLAIHAEELLFNASELRGKITQALDNQKVIAELQKMGVSKSEMQLRLTAMSDQELKQVQEGLQRQAGGEVVVVTTTALLIALILVLLLAR